MLQAPTDAPLDRSSQLDRFSLNALKKIARTLNLPVAAKDHAGYVAALVPFIGTPRHRAVLERRLAPAQWSLLGLLSLRGGPFRLRTVLVALRERQQLQPAAALEEVERLMMHGCLLSAAERVGDQRLSIDLPSLRAGGTEARYELAPGVAQWARDRQWAAPALAPTGPPASVAEPTFAALRRAAFLLLAEAARKPIRLTRQGLPYRPEVSRLATALLGGTTTTRPARKGTGAGKAPPVLWFALAALLGADLLVRQAQELVPADAATAFLGAPAAEQVCRLLAGWSRGSFDDLARVPTLSFSTYSDEDGAPPFPWVSHDAYDGRPSNESLTQARTLICSLLGAALAPNPAAWYPVDAFVALVYQQDSELLFPRSQDFALLYGQPDPTAGERQNAVPYFGIRRVDTGVTPTETLLLYPRRDWLEVEGAFVRQVIAESLRWLGLVEVGPGPAEPACFRLTEIGQHLLAGQPLAASPLVVADHAVVQPNFEVVVVDALAHGTLLAQLDQFAARRSLDRAATYQLTQDDLVRGLDHGWTGRRVIALLETVNGGPLPQNVGYTLREWTALYERLTLRERATVLDADDERQLDRWLADRELAPLLGSRLGPTSVHVAAAHIGRVMQLVAVRSKQKPTEVDYSRPPLGALELRDPDLIAIARGRVDPYLRYRLAAFARPAEVAEPTLLYRITAESVAGAVKAGSTGTKLAAFLEAATGRPLPDDLRTRLLGWSGAIETLPFETLVAVGCPAEPIGWSALQRIPAIGPLIRALPRPDLALVAPGDLERLRAELASRGITLRADSLQVVDQGPGPVNEAMQSMLAELLGSPLDMLALGQKAGLVSLRLFERPGKGPRSR